MVQDLNRIIRLKGRCIRATENVAFLRKCLEAYVTPFHIRKRVQKAKPKHPWAIERAFLRDELNKHQDDLEKAIEDYKRTLPTIRKELSFFDQLRFCKLISRTADRLCKQVRRDKNASLQRLRKAQLGQGELDHSVIINLAGIELSDVQKDVLCRGLNFSTPPRTDNISNEVKAEFELFWGQLSRQQPISYDRQKSCKAVLAGIAEKYTCQKVDKTGFPLRQEHFHAIRQLKQDTNIVITRPDKGNGVVILSRDDYVSKMNDVLSQEDKFKKIGPADEYDTTLQQERALQSFLLRAVRNKHLTSEVYDRIRPVGCTRPRMYGLPKTHKPNAPLRPILSMVNAPQHALAGWLTEVLRPVLDKYSAHTIRDTFHFCDNIDAFITKRSSSGTFMCSFDVVSLFTNIPLAETITICLDALYRDDSISQPSVPESLLRKLLLKATTEVEFSFDGVIYKQIDGVAMGSPLGPVLANIFVGFCESTVDSGSWPLLYNRFVDDTFSIFNSEEESLDFFHVLNGLHPNLRFTMEAEANGQLPFMDVLIDRVGDKFLRSVYRKHTFTGHYEQWDSFSPSSRKISLVRSLVSRAVRICSPTALPDELMKLRRIFEKNGYPALVVERTLQETVRKFAPTCEGSDGAMVPEVLQPKPVLPDLGPAPDRAVLRLPWIGQISQHYKKQITSTVNGCYPFVKPMVVFTTRTVFSGRAKDVLPTTLKSNVVYLFTCSCGLTYVGRTSQCLAERIKQHIPRDLLQRRTRAGVMVKQTDSAITKHLKSSLDCINAEVTKNFKILAQARSQQHLNVLEALFIQRLAPPLCNQKEHVRVLSLF